MPETPPTARPLAPLLSPASVAVVGASRNRAKVGGLVLANLLAAGYKGTVLAVNPAAVAAGEDVQGLTPLGSCLELPEGLDLAVVCLPREKTLPVLRELAERGVRAAAVLAAGFRETGRLGAEAEQALRDVAQKAGMLLLGPNSLGLINSALGLNASFALIKPKAGAVGFFSQSGALCVSVLDWAASQGLGFSSFVSLGNKACLGEAQVLRHLGDDPDTRVILGYCESVEDGARFMAAAREVAAKKPVLMLKAGATAAGARAVSAHTGSASGSPAAYRAALRQSGVVQVGELAQLCTLAMAFATQPLPLGPGLAVLTNAGGPGILAADACAKSALTLPRPSADTLTRLAEVLPGYASAYNPVDILGDAGPERYRAALAALFADTQTHAVLTLLTPTPQARPEATAKALIEIANGPDNAAGKPTAACFMGGDGLRRARALLTEAGIPCYDFPESAVEALDALYRQHRRMCHGDTACDAFLPGTGCDTAPLEAACGAPWDDEAGAIVDAALGQGLAELGGVTALEAVHAAGLPVLTTGLARTSSQAVRLAGEIGLPVSLRLAVQSLALDPATDPEPAFARLQDDESVRRAFVALTNLAECQGPQVYVTGCLVQAAAPQKSFSLSAGFVRDPQFGPLLSFGMRGPESELLGDVSHRLAPLSPADARAMLREVRFYPLLRGAGRGPAVSLAALERLLLALARMSLRLPRLAGAELSPVLAGPEGVFVAGARLVLG
jgi:acetyltransferase